MGHTMDLVPHKPNLDSARVELTPLHWEETQDAIRECNARAGDPANPDTVAFLGWEWTQTGPTPDEHFGHKNVVLAHTDDARIPTRPVAASEAACPHRR